MKTRFFRIVIAAVLLVAAVAGGIHIMNREALAQDITFTCYVYDVNTQEPVAGLDLDNGIWVEVQYSLDEFDRFEVFQGVIGLPGWYSITVPENTTLLYWEIEINAADIDLVLPVNAFSGQISPTQTHFEWQVIDNR
mgnify:CR=1 FL=1